MSNATANATLNVTVATAYKGTAALFLALERAAHSGVLVDAVLLAGLVAVITTCLCWRPRLTGAVVAAWLAWFGFRFAEGQSAWKEVVGHAQDARTATETAVGAVISMFASWFVLAAPALLDLERLLAPLAKGVWKATLHVWDALSWNERGIVALSFLAMGSSVVATRALWQHQDTVKQVLFQMSFAICGPLIWWLTSRLPHIYAILVVGVAMSLVPSLASLRYLFESAVGERGSSQGGRTRPHSQCVVCCT